MPAVIQQNQQQMAVVHVLRQYVKRLFRWPQRARVTKRNKATVLLTLTLFQRPTRAIHSGGGGGGGQGQLPPEKTIFTIFRMSY